MDFLDCTVLTPGKLHNWLLLTVLRAGSGRRRDRPNGLFSKQIGARFSIPQAFPQEGVLPESHSNTSTYSTLLSQ